MVEPPVGAPHHKWYNVLELKVISHALFYQLWSTVARISPSTSVYVASDKLWDKFDLTAQLSATADDTNFANDIWGGYIYRVDNDMGRPNGNWPSKGNSNSLKISQGGVMLCKEKQCKDFRFRDVTVKPTRSCFGVSNDVTRVMLAASSVRCDTTMTIASPSSLSTIEHTHIRQRQLYFCN